jgi:hypothetical protein
MWLRRSPGAAGPLGAAVVRAFVLVIDPGPALWSSGRS